MPNPAPWRPTHRLLAQHVRLLARFEDRFLIEFPDGSMGWVEEPLLPVEAVEREALHA